MNVGPNAPADDPHRQLDSVGSNPLAPTKYISCVTNGRVEHVGEALGERGLAIALDHDGVPAGAAHPHAYNAQVTPYPLTCGRFC